MTWVKLDDKMWRNPKVKALSPLAFRAHVSALCCCGEWMTDGYVSPETAVEVGAVDDVLVELTSVLVPGRGALWLPHVAGGYVIKDYLKYNPSRSEYEAGLEKRRARAKAGADARWNPPSNASSMALSNDVVDAPVPVPVFKPTVQEDSKRPPLPRMLAKILKDGIEQQLTTKQILQVTAAWEANSVELRQSMAAVETASNPPAYLVKVAQRIAPLEIGAA